MTMADDANLRAWLYRGRYRDRPLPVETRKPSKGWRRRVRRIKAKKVR